MNLCQEIQEKICPGLFFHVMCQGINKEYIFLSGYDQKSNTYIYIYNSDLRISEEKFDNLKINDLKISNEILVIYEKENESIKKFEINL